MLFFDCCCAKLCGSLAFRTYMLCVFLCSRCPHTFRALVLCMSSYPTCLTWSTYPVCLESPRALHILLAYKLYLPFVTLSMHTLVTTCFTLPRTLFALRVLLLSAVLLTVSWLRLSKISDQFYILLFIWFPSGLVIFLYSIQRILQIITKDDKHKHQKSINYD